MAEALYGNLTAAPELRFTSNGNAIATLRVAVNERVNENGQWRDGETTYHDVVVWRQQAEHAADAFSKGDRIVAAGRSKTRTWTKDDGTEGSKTEFVAEEIGPSLKFKSFADLVRS